MEHGSAGGEVITQTLVFLAATCVLIPALKKARISTVMGFLIIGVAMGPQVLGRLAETWPWLGAFALTEAEPTLLLAEFGVVFLMFVIGLEVSFERLWALRRFVFGLGLAQVVLSALAIGLVGAEGHDGAHARVGFDVSGTFASELHGALDDLVVVHLDLLSSPA